MLERLIRRGDKDKDGALSREEFMAVFSRDRPEQSKPDGGPPRPGNSPPFPTLFGALDSDHDGKLSAAEIAAAADVIRKLDKNSDGSVTFDEITSQTSEADGNGKP